MSNNAFDDLAQALEVLPNIGPKSAQRIAYHLLQYKRQETQHLIECLKKALRQIRYCRLCNTFCEDEICSLCEDTSRDENQLMVVQMPIDVQIMEAANCHKGRYFVLMGGIQPIHSKDLNHIALDKLKLRLEDKQLKEVVIATNCNTEGETTAFILQEILKKYPLKVSRLARGIPLGGELEFVDAGTLAQSFYERTPLKEG